MSDFTGTTASACDHDLLLNYLKIQKSQAQATFSVSLPTQGTNVNLTPERAATSLKLGTSSPVYQEGRDFFVKVHIVFSLRQELHLSQQQLHGASLRRLLRQRRRP